MIHLIEPPRHKPELPRALRSAWELLRDTYVEWGNDNGSQLGAALAFYTFFSLAPLLVLAIAVSGLAFGESAARGQIMGQIQTLLGPQAAQAIDWLLSHARRPEGSGLAFAVGFATILAGASGIVMALQNALDVIWKSKRASGLWRTISRYLFSYALVLGLGFLSLVSLVLSAALAAMGKYLAGHLPLPEGVLHAGDAFIAFVAITALFAMMFRWLPEVGPRLREACIGAAFTAALFVAGKYLLGLYIGRRAIGSMYGAAGSLVIVLLWVYYSAQILFLGVEFTKVYSRRRRDEASAASPSPASGANGRGAG